MNTLWNRIKYSVQADLHDLLDKKEQHNPITMLNEYIRAAEKQTDSTGRLLDRQAKLKAELEKERTEAAAMLEKRRDQLELAEKAGEEDLAEFARDEVRAYGTRVSELEGSILETENELIALERKFEEMKHKVKDMKVRQLQLMGKENATRAHRRMDAVIGREDSGPVASYGEMREYIENLGGPKPQAEADRSTMERRLDALTIIEECEKESV
ncbi:PspA/IM30 family protein [Edaphobacillus lindanitolerans]|uniref:Phage shock protein A (PspA) family protein n=1 Tax=Edaphobacillus lindanitolerans TaxID=550447 RepID=A0A1U7PNH2_9BACI|nr:PspA/IM30 family protein [Edaphobacillus lindanitolerans]SIT74961.1 phage shock protein A (PspA) family protein [Edaphobacillus lindanitolerans]